MNFGRTLLKCFPVVITFMFHFCLSTVSYSSPEADCFPPDTLKDFPVERKIISESTLYRLEEVSFPVESGKNIIAFLSIPARGKGPWPVLFYFHRAIETANTVLSFAEEVSPYGIAVFGFDAPGYGKRKDEYVVREWKDILEGRRQWIREGVRAITLLGNLPEIDASHVIVTGSSMGSFAAMVLSSVDSRVGGTVLLAGGPGKFTSILQQARKMGGITEEELICYEALSPLKAVSGITAPLLMISALDDEIITREETKTLFNAFTCEKTIRWLRDDHRFPVRKVTPLIVKWMNEKRMLGEFVRE